MRCSTLIHSGRHSIGALCTISLLFAFGPASLRAAEPDIPRVESDSPHYSIKQEIQFGAAYLTGQGVSRDLAKSAYWYERAADAGDPLSQNLVGYYYQNGMGVSRDPVRAAQWYQRAADGGFLEAKVNLAVAYLWGMGVKKDPQFAVELLSQAAAKNCGLADAYLGEIYAHGIGVPADQSAARNWYERGAHAGNSIAEYRLAALIILENGSKQSFTKATKLLRKSVEGGYLPAQHTLGMLLLSHQELASKPNEAVGLLLNASNAGIWQSSVMLGTLYRDGNGVAKDSSKAFFYFQIAQLQGGEKCHQIVNGDLVALSGELPPEETIKIVAEAKDRVTNQPLTLLFQYKDTGSSSEFPIFAIAAANDDTHIGKLIPAPSGKTDR
jgi:uncharacterized protein